MKAAIQRLWTVLVLGVTLMMVNPAVAANRGDVEKFLQITGFDVALDSIALRAHGAPAILGRDPGEFGILWQRMVQDVMDAAEIRQTALEMLEQTLDPDSLDHALAFYESNLGRRLVEAENAAYRDDDSDGKNEAGKAIVSALVRAGAEGAERLEQFRRMNAAVDSNDMSIRAMQEIQIRFLMAAVAAGVIDLKMDEPDLREMFRRQEPQIRASMKTGAVVNAAYTYQAFSDAELRIYADALENPKMQSIYELMNAVQHEITASRYEMLAARMAGLRPSQDL